VRRPHILKHNAGNEHFQRIIFFDSESRVHPDTHVHTPYLITARFARWREDGERHDTTKLYTPGFYIVTPHTMDTFWWDVDKFTRSKGVTYMFAHNAAYDVLALDGVRELSRRGWTAVSYFEKGPVFILRWKREDRSLVIVSSTNYFAGSLAQLGVTFGLPKMEVDYENTPLDEMVPYAVRDLDILDRAVTAFINFVQDEDLGVQSLTVAGQTFNAYRHRFMPYPIYLHAQPDVLSLERRGYTGGRVECWRIGGLSVQTYHKLDVNSMYPYVMREEKYPTKLLWYRTRGDLNEITQAWLHQSLCVMASVTVNTDEPCYATLINGHLVYPVGTFKTTLTTNELIYAYAHGHIVDVSECAAYECEAIFTEYVDYFYEKKMTATNDVLRNFYKLMMNSLYGKFGQRSHDMERLGDAPVDEIGQMEYFNRDTGERWTEKTFGGSVFKISDATESVGKESFNSFPAIAAHVTANARMLLWRYITIAGVDNVVYMDTDSLFVTDRGYANLTDVIDDKRLGALKHEDSTERLILRNPKDYTFGETTKRKGISKNATQLDDTTFVTEQWPKFNGMINNGMPQYANVIRTKHLDTEYKKAFTHHDGTTSPVRMTPLGEVMPVKDVTNGKTIIARYGLTKSGETPILRVWGNDPDTLPTEG
jgi:hypothetical protein